ncbi:condensin complex subunit 2-like [Drosophila miranda]|uniref:condensin complex subunit 2-like n=1 Tax=Drosophila miranda TaxID=7229 RepID=UPI00143F1557|nr:condensin complex subunit 2-like [Drosophila miranda]XP_033241912.1 condensin complex subunit 2-like [Drosophila miranda]
MTPPRSASPGRRSANKRKSSTLESIEENETVRSSLDLYNCNKLSIANAWDISLIDTLANLMDSPHKKLSSFRMAGSLLQVLCKVYGLRVDSIYIDACRISAGLNARTLTGLPEGPPGDGEERNLSTLAKNKEKLNARLDMVPMQDSIFAKLNSTVGSLDASDQMMHNILPSVDFEMRLRPTYKFFDDTEGKDELMDSETLSAGAKEWPDEELCNAEWLHKLYNRTDDLNLRPLHTGYVITNPNTPNPKPQSGSISEAVPSYDDDAEGLDNAHDIGGNRTEPSVAFDMNAECEPMPDIEAGPPIILDIQSNDLQELTAEEQTVITNCRRLKKTAEFIDDLRPVDGVTRLDYSYRPMDQISQLCAAPAHWKFRITRPRTTLDQTTGPKDALTVGNPKKTKTAAAAAAAKPRMKELHYGKGKEELFQPLDANIKQQKVNYQKKCDARKLMPTKSNNEADYQVSQRFGKADLVESLGNDVDMDRGLHHGDADRELFDNENFTTDDSVMNRMSAADIEDPMDMMNKDSCGDMPNQSQSMHEGEDTIMEISTEFKGAPRQVSKVIGPFAKRAKVIDMKNLKNSCHYLIQKQFLSSVNEASIPSLPLSKEESYAKGTASFQEVYRSLPDVLSDETKDSLCPSVALNAVLHLANDMKLRLISQENLEDFQIRQVLDDEV